MGEVSLYIDLHQHSHAVSFTYMAFPLTPTGAALVVTCTLIISTPAGLALDTALLLTATLQHSLGRAPTQVTYIIHKPAGLPPRHCILTD